MIQACAPIMSEPGGKWWIGRSPSWARCHGCWLASARAAPALCY